MGLTWFLKHVFAKKHKRYLYLPGSFDRHAGSAFMNMKANQFIKAAIGTGSIAFLAQKT